MKYSLLMIRPVRFGYNAETAVNNAFQKKGIDNEVQQKALKEFDDFVALLRSKNIEVLVIEDTPDPHTPDSIFPNNWISFHEDGSIFLYPMFASNRRLERKQHVLKTVLTKYPIREVFDYSIYEASNRFLEGTGSMILDRINKYAYACISPRTDPELFKKYCNQIGYTPVIFLSKDQNGQEIYHTNVMMCIADKYCVICLESIGEDKKNVVKDIISSSGKEIIDISFEQMNHFAGNMLQVFDIYGQAHLVMSSQAYHSLNKQQIDILSAYNPILHAPLDTIEQNGGGSARCMMAEVPL